ncbi:iron uptake transporter deferrochelatase/peroxidase subunit [Dermatobacter hominis]|uniref:iron uptake transporter deferrochelatase/peroxidase subunit n=1 Tax=Dermatobacter hominis TaxID=2884263 RepID=UPI001D0FE724|nr:iron uptake transporter deferrochelatase/peroxidase subunit [Dermatobacter hominis]UDY35304.1 iron uptake transporter deferrochelatase/peroxidase subunit [Dermatobacter hominis]
MEPTDADTDVTSGEDAPDRGVPRRWLLGAAGVGAVVAGAGIGVAVASASDTETVAGDGDDPAGSVPFRGAHQAGIVTPTQDRLHFAAFDVTTEDRDKVIALLQRWTSAAERMTQGHSAGTTGAMNGPLDAPPADTGEAYGLPPSQLTITIGFGPSLFVRDGVDRFGLADRRPAALIDLPHFPADRLDPARTGGDLCVQACANDPQVAVHAVRNLARMAFGVAAVRWSQLGFGRTSSTSTTQTTPRNLFGFKDGTANLKAEQTDLIDSQVWVGRGDDPAAEWMAGGSYLVARRISMHIETWDRTSLREQETIVGRDKGEGAPLSGGTEFTAVDLDAKGADGPDIALNSHVRLAHPDENGGVQMLRRGYNFTDGTDGLGRLDAGLFFIAFVRDPRQQYVPMQTKLSRDDALSEYLLHTGSGLFAVPPGADEPDAWIGEPLFS